MAVIVTLFESDSCTGCGANCPVNSREPVSAPPLPVCEKTATTLVQTAAQILDTATSGIPWKSSNPARISGSSDNCRRPSSALSHSDRKSTRLNSSHRCISYAVFCLKKKLLHSDILRQPALGGLHEVAAELIPPT